MILVSREEELKRAAILKKKIQDKKMSAVDFIHKNNETNFRKKEKFISQQDLLKMEKRRRVTPKPRVVAPLGATTVKQAKPASKGRKKRAKDDPNYIFCFRCQEEHHVDKHKVGFEPQRVRNLVAGRSGIPLKRSEIPREFLGKRAQRRYSSEENEEEEDEDDYDYDDDFVDKGDYGGEGALAQHELRKITGYNPAMYSDDDDDHAMEVRDFSMMEREDDRAYRIGQREDEEEARREEYLRRKRMQGRR